MSQRGHPCLYFTCKPNDTARIAAAGKSRSRTAARSTNGTFSRSSACARTVAIPATNASIAAQIPTRSRPPKPRKSPLILNRLESHRGNSAFLAAEPRHHGGSPRIHSGGGALQRWAFLRQPVTRLPILVFEAPFEITVPKTTKARRLGPTAESRNGCGGWI
jgi:hypothetical protein